MQGERVTREEEKVFNPCFVSVFISKTSYFLGTQYAELEDRSKVHN